MSADRFNLRRVGWVASVPVLGVVLVLVARYIAFRPTDKWLEASLCASRGSAQRGAGWAVCDLSTGALGTLLASGGLLALAWWAVAVRTGRRRARWPEVALSVILGSASAFSASRTGFWSLATANGTSARSCPWELVVTVVVGWIASWAGTLAMAGCLLPTARERPADALARLRILLYANAVLVACASATSVLAYRAAVARLPDPLAMGLDATTLGSLERATAAFYVAVLVAKFVPAWGILASRAAGPSGLERASRRTWNVFATIAKDTVAVFSPAIASFVVSHWSS